jgi:dimethylhistidine N-methyltransferase
MTDLAYRGDVVPLRQPLPEAGEFGAAMLAGLDRTTKWISAKFFYDTAGSLLFDQICALPEYYPTRTEMGLLQSHAHEFAKLIGPDATLIEFGAGSSRKVGLLLDALVRPRAYEPVDISGDYLHDVAKKLRETRPALAVHPIVADFTKPFALPSGDARRIGFFPGSTIGNFDRADALAFLRRAARLLKGGGFLIGVDLVKSPDRLHAAYNDAAGVTEAFNKNLLVRANRELHADFDLDAFAHYAFYNPTMRRIEMHLVSLTAQCVSLCGRRIFFAEGETIHTESSYKYTVDGFAELAEEAGFVSRKVWCDKDRLFSMHWLEALG